MVTFLLHDIGSGDGIFQVGPQDTANKLRTAPPVGPSDKARFMHRPAVALSLKMPSIAMRARCQETSRRFRDLSQEDREALITFLKSL